MSRPFKTVYVEDLTLGMTEAFTKTVTSEDVVAFAHLSGDCNPIHLDAEYAKTTRFGERIAHGMYSASFVSAVIGMYLPGPGTVYLSQTLNFKAPVKLGDVVTTNVEVVELIEKGRRVRLKCEGLVDGKVVLDGEALVLAPGRPK